MFSNQFNLLPLAMHSHKENQSKTSLKIIVKPKANSKFNLYLS